MIALTQVRQNAHEVRSSDFYSFVEEESLITCPYGHTIHLTKNIHNGKYNTEANGQDKKFIENLCVNDYIVIPIEGMKKCIIKRITSEPKVKIFENIFDIRKNGKIISIKKSINITDEEKKDINLVFEPKQMYYRDCINLGIYDYDFNNRFAINSICNVKSIVIKNFVLSKINIV